jgi:hypothetical protein
VLIMLKEKIPITKPIIFFFHVNPLLLLNNYKKV